MMYRVLHVDVDYINELKLACWASTQHESSLCNKMVHVVAMTLQKNKSHDVIQCISMQIMISHHYASNGCIMLQL